VYKECVSALLLLSHHARVDSVHPQKALFHNFFFFLLLSYPLMPFLCTRVPLPLSRHRRTPQLCCQTHKDTHASPCHPSPLSKCSPCPLIASTDAGCSSFA
jgi:hypothetical protein